MYGQALGDEHCRVFADLDNQRSGCESLSVKDFHTVSGHVAANSAPDGGPHRPEVGSGRPAEDLDNRISGTRSAPAQTKVRGLSYPIVRTVRDARARRLGREQPGR